MNRSIQIQGPGDGAANKSRLPAVVWFTEYGGKSAHQIQNYITEQLPIVQIGAAAIVNFVSAAVCVLAFHAHRDSTAEKQRHGNDRQGYGNE